MNLLEDNKLIVCYVARLAYKNDLARA